MATFKSEFIPIFESDLITHNFGLIYVYIFQGIDRKFGSAELWQRELPNFESFRNFYPWFFSLKRAKISSENTIMEIQYSKNTISIVFPQFYFHYIVFPQLYFHYIVFPHSENTSSVRQNFRRSFWQRIAEKFGWFPTMPKFGRSLN